jgi:glycine/D-amino acid oxidase-like deaminating enzyme
MAEQVIVVGGGLAGLSAAHTVLEHGGRVLLLDKCPFLGGNSTKATSGINGALTRTQAKAGIDDSADKFEADIIRGAAGVGHTSAPAHTIPLAKVRDLPGGAPRNAASIFRTNPDRARVARYFNSDPAPPARR